MATNQIPSTSVATFVTDKPAELAASLPSVQALHLLDRTAIPWQAKDIGRDTLVRYHNDKTLRDLPFAGERRHALYRKIDDGVAPMAQFRKSHPALKSVVPTLASLLARLKASGQLVSDTQALGQLVEQITMTLLFSLDYQRILDREGEVRLVVYQIMMLVAPHLDTGSRHAAEQLALRYLDG